MINEKSTKITRSSIGPFLTRTAPSRTFAGFTSITTGRAWTSRRTFAGRCIDRVDANYSTATFLSPASVVNKYLQVSSPIPMSQPSHSSVVETSVKVASPQPNVFPTPLHVRSGPACLMVHYSKAPVENAIGMWTPGPGTKISAFKILVAQT